MLGHRPGPNDREPGAEVAQRLLQQALRVQRRPDNDRRRWRARSVRGGHAAGDVLRDLLVEPGDEIGHYTLVEEVGRGTPIPTPPAGMRPPSRSTSHSSACGCGPSRSGCRTRVSGATRHTT